MLTIFSYTPVKPPARQNLTKCSFAFYSVLDGRELVFTRVFDIKLNPISQVAYIFGFWLSYFMILTYLHYSTFPSIHPPFLYSSIRTKSCWKTSKPFLWHLPTFYFSKSRNTVLHSTDTLTSTQTHPLQHTIMTGCLGHNGHLCLDPQVHPYI